MPRNLKTIWLDKYAGAADTLNKVKNVRAAATAFNTNIDAVLKISGQQIEQLIKKVALIQSDLENDKSSVLNSAKDVVRGIIKCFSRGIAEEWIAEDKAVYEWMVDNLGYDRLQMGGQGGIVANVLGVIGVQKVYAHTNSLPKLQAEQFLKLGNVLSFDDQGKEAPAYQIDRKSDIPLIHWIVEFDKNDSFSFNGKEYVCPKSNRFIATYDPLNLHLVIDDNFVKHMRKNAADFVILSGFHALTEQNDGVRLQASALPYIEEWKKNGAVLHLEIASTQDKVVRQAIVETLAPKADSVGINEREAIDILEVCGEEILAQKCEKETHSCHLFEALLRIKKKLGCKRIQLHMFGLYMTLQDKGFKVTPEENLRGMVVAATVAAGKAGVGNLDASENLLWAAGKEVSDVGLKELCDLAACIGSENLPLTGIAECEGFDLIAVPTIIIEKPVTLVGMGDTISSVSLVAAR